MAPIKLISWNVNGIRSIFTKEKNGTKHKDAITNNSLMTLMLEQSPDVVCLQEIRCSNTFNIAENLDLEQHGYQIIGQNCSKAKAGYSGTLVISRIPALQVIRDFPQFPIDHDLNKEGRIITVEFEKFVLINVYVPNSQQGLTRLDFRIKQWEAATRQHINDMQKKYKKPVILCGDINVAPQEIDVHNPKAVKGKHGFTAEERQAFTKLLQECNMIDSFRFLHPTTVLYSWWSNFAKSRERNVGWRIDVFTVSSVISKKIKEADILGEYKGSDHAPITLSLTL